MKDCRQNVYLVWLNWPERCFRADSGDIAYLKSLVACGARVVRVTSERAFLRELPKATHAIVWNFRKEWFALRRASGFWRLQRRDGNLCRPKARAA